MHLDIYHYRNSYPIQSLLYLYVMKHQKMQAYQLKHYINMNFFTKLAFKLDNIMQILPCIIITCFSCWQLAIFYNYLLIYFSKNTNFKFNSFPWVIINLVSWIIRRKKSNNLPSYINIFVVHLNFYLNECFKL